MRAARRQALRAFQAARLARTHADLRHSPRYGRAAEFFLTDLYSPRDLGPRDAEIERVLPLMTNTLPVSGLRALLLAAEVDAVSEQFDAAMVNALRQALDAALAQLAQGRDPRVLQSNQPAAQSGQTPAAIK